MAQCHALLRAATESGIAVGKVLERANSLLLEMNNEGLFVTVIYGILHKSSGEFQYARAGHEPLLILDSQGQISSPGGT